MNYLWGGMILVGIIYGTASGNLKDVTEAAVNSSKEAVSLCIAMAGVTAMWVGIMRIAENSGLIQRMVQRMNPLLDFLFPEIPKEDGARKHIAMNMIANLLGLGWAATPAGLQAMESLSRLEEERRMEEKVFQDGKEGGTGIEKRGKYQAVPPGTASNEMCTFLILNISSLQLIPINIIAYRTQYGSVNPTVIVGPAMVATAVSTGVAVIYCKIKNRRR
ncbi:MAG: nucleoside recognition protein [Oliverpabstia sp.]|nr:nucleoside recognition protein [Oliverpabstia sp.]